MSAEPEQEAPCLAQDVHADVSGSGSGLPSQPSEPEPSLRIPLSMLATLIEQQGALTEAIDALIGQNVHLIELLTAEVGGDTDEDGAPPTL